VTLNAARLIDHVYNNRTMSLSESNFSGSTAFGGRAIRAIADVRNARLDDESNYFWFPNLVRTAE